MITHLLLYYGDDKLVVYYSFTCKCSNVTPSVERLGDLLISDHCIHFVSDDAVRDFQTNLQVNYQVKVKLSNIAFELSSCLLEILNDYHYTVLSQGLTGYLLLSQT